MGHLSFVLNPADLHLVGLEEEKDKEASGAGRWVLAGMPEPPEELVCGLARHAFASTEDAALVPVSTGSSCSNTLLQGLVETVCRSNALPMASELLRRFFKDGPAAETLTGSMDQLAAVPHTQRLRSQIRALRRRRVAAGHLLNVVEQEVEAIDRQLREKAAEQVALLERSAPFGLQWCLPTEAIMATQEEALKELATLEGEPTTAGLDPAGGPQLLRSAYKSRVRELEERLSDREARLQAAEREIAVMRRSLLAAAKGAADRHPAATDRWPSCEQVTRGLGGRQQQQPQCALLFREQGLSVLGRFFSTWRGHVSRKLVQERALKRGLLAFAAHSRRTLLRCVLGPWRAMGALRRKRQRFLQVKGAHHLVTRTRLFYAILVLLQWSLAARRTRAEANAPIAHERWMAAREVQAPQAAPQPHHDDAPLPPADDLQASDGSVAAAAEPAPPPLEDEELRKLSAALQQLRRIGAPGEEFSRAIDGSVEELKKRLGCPRTDRGPAEAADLAPRKSPARRQGCCRRFWGRPRAELDGRA